MGEEEGNSQIEIQPAQSKAISPISTERDFGELWASFSVDQKKFAIARLNSNTDTQAAEECNLPYERVKHWSNKQEINAAVRMMLDSAKDTALATMERSIMRAVFVKLDGLDAKPEIAQAAATELLDRVLGKPVQRVAPTNPQGTEQYSPHNAVSDERLLHLLELARERRLKALSDVTITTVDTTAIDVTTTTEPPLEQK